MNERWAPVRRYETHYEVSDISELERIMLKQMMAILTDGGALDGEAQDRFETIENRLTSEGRI